MKKVLGLVLVAAFLVVSFGFIPAASAEAQTSEEALVRGAGVLIAQGDGIAILGGRGVVDLSGNGLLWVRDLTGNATIQVTGYGERKEFNDGWVQYSGFDGTAHIEGARIIVVIAGVDVDLEAQGYGRAILWGHGTCELNGEQHQWNMRLGLRMRLHHGENNIGPGQQGASYQWNNGLGLRMRLHHGEYSAGPGAQNGLTNGGGF